MAFVERYGNAYSEDGWRMVDEAECDWMNVPGTDVTLQIRKGVPATILTRFAQRFNETIEPLRDADSACWTPTNDVPTSNHMAGTACDLNWDSHPFHVAGTFGDRLPKLRALLDEFKGCVWWGGDWQDPIDEMHFQLAYPEGDQRLIDLANEIQAQQPSPPIPKAEMTVPLVDNGDGTWTSPSPAWAHLIMRESGGNPTIIQQITDVNSGGNEAEGLFQITPATWRAHRGDEFAPSARLATPQQQAAIAARIFTANPSGSDWGAGLPGREDAAELAAGLVPITATPPEPVPVEEDWMVNAELERMIRELHAVWCTDTVPSTSRYGDPTIKWLRRDMLQNDDGFWYDLWTEHNAALGDEQAQRQIQAAAAKGDKLAAAFLQRLTAGPSTAPTQPPPVAPPTDTTTSTPPQNNPPTPPVSAGSLTAAVARFSAQLDAAVKRIIG